MSQRDYLLREMGLGPLWKLREQAAAAPETAEVAEAAEAASTVEPAVQSEARAEAPPVARAERAAPAAPTAPAAPARPIQAINGDVASMNWPQLAEAVSECRACDLCAARKQAVLGVGDQQADWLFVGEGPGAEEDERGEPFVGQAGKLLDAMLAAIDLKRGENVYIANAVKCRPPNNRTPEPEEIATCSPYLARQIALLQPKLIVALGRPAAQALLQREVKIGASRGQLFDYQGIPVIITYHPAYLLRNLHDKASAWEDLCFARKTMG